MNILSEKCLFLGHIPPPLHGASIIGEKILSLISSKFECIFLKVNFSKSVESIGEANLFQSIAFFSCLYIKLLMNLIVHRPKVIYLTPSLNGGGFYRDLIILLLAYVYTFTGARVLCHIHMRPLILLKKPMLHKLWCFLTKKFEVILLSESLLLDYLPRFNPKALHFLANTSAVSTIDCTKPTNTFDILYVGHISKSKGAFRVLELTEKFNSNYVFHFAGEFASASEKSEFNSFIEKSEATIKYYGRVDGVSKAELFNQADLLLLPSFSEAQPLSIIEAFSCGLPVISTPVGGVVDMLDDSTGRCVPFEKFTQSILEVSELEKSNFSANCIIQYNKKFSEKAFNSNCLRIFGGENEFSK